MGVCGSKRVEGIVQHPTPALSAPASAAGGPTKAGPVCLSGYGEHTFAGVTADKYLKKHGGSAAWLDSADWVTTRSQADIVAKAVLDWAIDNGADTFCHWFQPLASNGLRPGLSGQVQNKMVRPSAAPADSRPPELTNVVAVRHSDCRSPSRRARLSGPSMRTI